MVYPVTAGRTLGGVQPLAPKRDKLAEALAAVTDRHVSWWRGWARLPPAGLDLARAPGRPMRLPIADRSDGAEGPFLTARVTVEGPAEAWEAITTALDLHGWVDDPARRFAPHRIIAVGRRRREPWAESEAWDPVVTYEPTTDARSVTVVSDEGWSLALPHPGSVADCVALASDPRAVATAEEIARHAVALPEWRGPRPARVVWRVLSPEDTTRKREDERAAIASRDPPWPDGLKANAAYVDLLATGYALDSVTDDAAVLLAPAL